MTVLTDSLNGMRAPVLVLDTNVFRGTPTEHLASLRNRGFTIRVSDLALPETWARSVRNYRDGTASRPMARGLLFTKEQQLAALRDYLKTICWKMSGPVADRFDAHIAVTALRLHSAGLGARMPKENDGADLALTMHIAEGCVLVTNETQLVKLVDDSKTYQAPWVRRLNDLDDLPQGPPWGEGARRLAQSFRRKS